MGERRKKSTLAKKKIRRAIPLGLLRSPIFFLFDPIFYIFSPGAEPGPRLLLKNSTLAEISGMLDRSYGLTSWEKCKFFDYHKMTFLSSKNPPFEKTTSSNDNA